MWKVNKKINNYFNFSFVLFVGGKRVRNHILTSFDIVAVDQTGNDIAALWVAHSLTPFGCRDQSNVINFIIEQIIDKEFMI